MLNISGLENGVVLDHIPAGKGMDIYKYLKLEQYDSQVAIIKNATSSKMGKKDIIKISGDTDKIDVDAIGFIDPNITVNVIRNGSIIEKKRLTLPKKRQCDPERQHHREEETYTAEEADEYHQMQESALHYFD